jgi:superfamily II DNA helicase RecQ
VGVFLFRTSFLRRNLYYEVREKSGSVEDIVECILEHYSGSSVGTAAPSGAVQERLETESTVHGDTVMDSGSGSVQSVPRVRDRPATLGSGIVYCLTQAEAEKLAAGAYFSWTWRVRPTPNSLSHCMFTLSPARPHYDSCEVG